MAGHLRTELPAAALANAAEFARLADRHQVRLSHGRTGQCWDNALAEGFFSAIKGELLDDQSWPTRATARSAITEYIAWYDGTRLHSALGYKPPAEYEASRQENLEHVACQAPSWLG